MSALAPLTDKMDKLPEYLIIRTIASMYEDGTRGLFSDKFIPYRDIKDLGYRGFKRMLQSICEVDEDFLKKFSWELEELIERTINRLGEPETIPESEEQEIQSQRSKPKSQNTEHERNHSNEQWNSIGDRELDDRWGSDLYA